MSNNISVKIKLFFYGGGGGSGQCVKRAEKNFGSDSPDPPQNVRF